MAAEVIDLVTSEEEIAVIDLDDDDGVWAVDDAPAAAAAPVPAPVVATDPVARLEKAVKTLLDKPDGFLWFTSNKEDQIVKAGAFEDVYHDNQYVVLKRRYPLISDLLLEYQKANPKAQFSASIVRGMEIEFVSLLEDIKQTPLERANDIYAAVALLERATKPGKQGADTAVKTAMATLAAQTVVLRLWKEVELLRDELPDTLPGARRAYARFLEESAHGTLDEGVVHDLELRLSPVSMATGLASKLVANALNRIMNHLLSQKMQLVVPPAKAVAPKASSVNDLIPDE